MTFLTSLSFHCQKKKRKTTLCTWSTYLQVAYRSRIWLCCNPTSGATKSHSQMRCSKTRPRLEIASEQKQKKKGRKRKKKIAVSSSCVLSIVISLVFCRLVVLVWAVRQTVPSQVTVAPKHLSAAATAVGLDVCMGEKVSFQVTSLIKGSSACGAFVG